MDEATKCALKKTGEDVLVRVAALIIIVCVGALIFNVVIAVLDFLDEHLGNNAVDKIAIFTLGVLVTLLILAWCTNTYAKHREDCIEGD